ncbi:hypothetical protein EJ04DRAFT_598034 [Polyplosphaeria fusca]|uniref:Uncharacterized protein n=1 Tax=Polyplosphaeria fusca TaxID=682080 RepID=A0A9P4R3U6_9PLEO|nr:hypothetical protein EJ04DRAFT_598034 [Polyplosphaeria fusca]
MASRSAQAQHTGANYPQQGDLQETAEPPKSPPQEPEVFFSVPVIQHPQPKRYETASFLNFPFRMAQEAPQRVAVVPNAAYTDDILCFTASTSAVSGEVRTTIDSVCHRKGVKYHTSTLKVPRDEISKGSWTLAVAPNVLGSDLWVLAFGVPRDSQMIWFYWPKTAGSQERLLEYLQETAKGGNLVEQVPMRVGESRHKLFHAMVEQGVWAAYAGMKYDWESHEFGEDIEP